MARQRPDKSLARFDRIALVLSGGGALGAYQAGVCAALDKCGVRPNWIAGTAIGAVHAAIIAGNSPEQCMPRLRRFWQQLGEHAKRQPRWRWSARSLIAARGRWLSLRRGGPPSPTPREPIVDAAELRDLIGRVVDFDRLNSGEVRVVLGAVNLATGAETFFDNDRLVLGPEHVLAGRPLPGSPPVMIGREWFGGAAVSVSALDGAPPGDTLCFAIDGYDPAPGEYGGISRTTREIGAMRRAHDLRRMIALLGERLPASVRGETDIRRCLAEASQATMTILHLVHEGSVDDLGAKATDFSAASLNRLWSAGESDAAMSLAHPSWLAPPGGVAGVVVHEVRNGIAAPPR